MPDKTISQTKEWKAAYMKTWRAENCERLSQYDKKYRSGNDRYRAWKLEYDRAYYNNVTKSDPQQLERRRQNGIAWRKANPEKHAARCKRHRDAHRAERAAKARIAYQAMSVEERRAFRAKHASKKKQWREKNSEHLREYAANRHLDNIERQREHNRAHYRKNPLPYIQRARKRQGVLTGDYTNADIHAMYKAQRGLCCGCRVELNGTYEIDHVMPLSLDSTGDRLDNLQLLCRPCNRKKRAMHPDVWATRIGKLFT